MHLVFLFVLEWMKRSVCGAGGAGKKRQRKRKRKRKSAHVLLDIISRS
jgi:hypothetical protein